MTERTVLLSPSNGTGHDANYRLTVLVPKRRFFSYLRTRWWLVLLCVAASVAGILAYETVRAPAFSSYARIYVREDTQVNLSSLFSESANYYGTQIELLKSPRLRTEALQSLDDKIPKELPKVEVVRPVG